MWFLGTRDAHQLYAKFGFIPPNERAMVRLKGARPSTFHASVAAVPFPLPGHHAYHRACPTREKERCLEWSATSSAETMSSPRSRVSSSPFPGPCGLLFGGEAGIGKTALWSEAVGTARGLGIVVLSTRPVESETTFSYSALGDLSRTCSRRWPATYRLRSGGPWGSRWCGPRPLALRRMSMRFRWGRSACSDRLRVGSAHPRYRRCPMDRSVVGSSAGVRRSSPEG